MINSRFDAQWLDDHEQLDQALLRERLAGQDVVLTSWGTPPLPADLLGAGNGGPTVVAHAAGTIKNLVPAESLDKISIFSAAPRIAWSVGEYCLTALLTLLRRLPEYDDWVRHGGWKTDSFRGRELRGLTVGIVGASSTARAFIELLRPFGVEIWVYDPYLSAEQAAQLGVRSVSLEQVVGCSVLSVHVPATPATEGLITADLISRIPDGGIVINSSRAAAVDTAALINETATGRLQAALDVYPSEPPELPESVLGNGNLLLTPHIAGDSVDGHRALVRYVLDDVIDFLEHDRRGPSWVDPAKLSITA
ncbi:NAD(P)-dependent oxidoreductase [Microlunatus elymi]|nr:NAD(P)-dependent oxidoreductase [Microlunatus elymi]